MEKEEQRTRVEQSRQTVMRGAWLLGFALFGKQRAFEFSDAGFVDVSIKARTEGF